MFLEDQICGIYGLLHKLIFEQSIPHFKIFYIVHVVKFY